MIYTEIIAAFSECHTNRLRVIAFCGQNMEFLNAKPVGTNS